MDDNLKAVFGVIQQIKDELHQLHDNAPTIGNLLRAGAEQRCTCGKARWQHDTQWPACKGFTPANPG